MVTERPSKLAAAAILWTLLYLGKGDWNMSLEYHTSYTRNDLIILVAELTELVISVSPNIPGAHLNLGNIFEKYASDAFFKVANVYPERLVLVSLPKPGRNPKSIQRMDL